MLSNMPRLGGPIVRLIPARDEEVAFFLHFSLCERSLPLMEDLSSFQPCWRSLCLAGGVDRTEARASV
jgi:hypothetical protein